MATPRPIHADAHAEPAQLPGLQQHVPLAPFTTFGIGGPARWFLSVTTEAELAAACSWVRAQGVPLFVLGGGSNVLVSDGGFAGLVLHICLKGMDSRKQAGKQVFSVAAGEDWDRFVTNAVAHNCAGIECLAGIPGTVGGTPVQNVGAYGQEVAQTIAGVRCFDRETEVFLDLDPPECGFAYRSSRFNTGADRGRFIVTHVYFRLTPGGAPSLAYADLRQYFSQQHPVIAAPSLTQVADAVRAIRARKGMVVGPEPLLERDPDTRSAGSFFKNPVVPVTVYETIAASVAPLPVPAYPAPDAADGGAQRKLAAAWLLEQAGFPKGFRLGAAAISNRHTLALTNWSGHATAEELLALRDLLVAGVLERFGVVLEPEPVFLSDPK